MNLQPLLAFYLINSRAQFSDRTINDEIAHSLLYVIEKFFVQHGSSSSFIIVMSYEREQTMNFYKDLSEILFGSYDNIKTQIVVHKGMHVGPSLVEIRMRIFNMLVVDSLKSFLNIDLASKVQNFDINEFYQIFLYNEERFLEADMKEILRYCWSNYIINVNVMIQTSYGELIVYTYYPFTNSHCGEVIPVEINRFRNGRMTNPELFPQKLKNMHKCPIKSAVWHIPPYMILDRTKRSREAVSGFEGQLLKQLSLLMNFTIEITEPPNNEERGVKSGNRSTGATKMLITRSADLSLGSFWFTERRSRILTASDTYFQCSNVGVLVRNSLNYDSPRTLWFPFKWRASITLISSFIVILSMGYVFDSWTNKISTVVPYVKQRNRCLNFIAWTLGLPSWTLPVQSSRRIYVMSWILFGLVIRSLYAGIIYHLLRNNLFRRAPSTISEVVEQDYTILMNTPGYRAMAQTSIFSDTGLKFKIIELGSEESPIFGYLEKHSSERFLAIAPLDYVLHYSSNNMKAGVLTILKDTIMLQNLCIYFTKHSFLVDRVNLLLQQIDSAGLLDIWFRQTINWLYLKSTNRPQEIVIGQGELKGIYFIWISMMIVAFLVFCFEVASVKLKFLEGVFNKL